MSRDGKLHWGILATSEIVAAITNALRQSDRSILLGIASRDLSRAQAYAHQNQIPRAYASYEALLEDPDIDVIYNPLPNALHGTWTLQALACGKHVLCEKPLVTSLAEFDDIRARALDSGLVVTEAFMSLHHPQTAMVKNLLSADRIGAVRVAQAWFGYTLPQEETENIRLSAHLHGGSFWDVGVYPNSMIVYLLGAPPLEVTATKTTNAGGVDLSFAGQMRFRGEVLGQIWSSFRTPFQQALRIIGEKGIIEVPVPWMPGMKSRTELGPETVLTVYSAVGDREEVRLPAENPFLCEVHEMETSVIDGCAPLLPLDKSRQFLVSALALQRAADNGEAVVLDHCCPAGDSR